MRLDGLCRALWSRIEPQLREMLGARFAAYAGWLDAVIALCQRQLEFTRLSDAELEKLLPQVPTESAGRSRWLDEQAQAIAHTTAASQFVADCVQIAGYRHVSSNCARTEAHDRHPRSPQESRQCPEQESANRHRIRCFYWREYGPTAGKTLLGVCPSIQKNHKI